MTGGGVDSSAGHLEVEGAAVKVAGMVATGAFTPSGAATAAMAGAAAAVTADSGYEAVIGDLARPWLPRTAAVEVAAAAGEVTETGDLNRTAAAAIAELGFRSEI